MLPNDLRKAIKATQLIEPDLKPGQSEARTKALNELIRKIKIQNPSCFLDENKSNAKGIYAPRMTRYDPPRVTISSVKNVPIFISAFKESLQGR